MNDDSMIPYQFESPDQRSDHFANLHFAGCPNCGYAIDVTIPAIRHADAALSIIVHLLDDAAKDDVKKAIYSMRGWYDEQLTFQLIEDAEFIELKSVWEKAMDRAASEAPKRNRNRAKSKVSTSRKPKSND